MSVLERNKSLVLQTKGTTNTFWKVLEQRDRCMGRETARKPWKKIAWSSEKITLLLKAENKKGKRNGPLSNLALVSRLTVIAFVP
jgi:hypothetical protein